MKRSVQETGFLICIGGVSGSDLGRDIQRIFTVFPCPSKQIPGQYLEISHDPFHLSNFQFIITHPTNQCYGLELLHASLNNPYMIINMI
jgi:hypothetical protein